ncbi:transglutaminase-like domain-containing protein [Polluticaenibacter yanchengensis]|uniref:Transglutaminase-like domain-containing protein n=1 Tax=Polluticaenibacter yanchengensis TaxID=3014562 RepID=A0ABT4UIX2_9BACT|nr:transglutaminase-like domain-containing protein [Chitinophagaceae bacterium LY-5]
MRNKQKGTPVHTRKELLAPFKGWGLSVRVHTWKKELAQYILLGIPTIILAAYVLFTANEYFEFLQNNWLKQSIAFAAGLYGAFFIYARRFRFITTAAAIIILAYIGYEFSTNLFSGEFDGFKWAVKYQNFSVLFVLGWFAGYGLSRTRFFSIFWSIALLAVMIIVVGAISTGTSDDIVLMFAPILVYAFYIIYTSELIRNMSDHESAFALNMVKRMGGFALVIFMLLLALLAIFRTDFDVIEREWGAGANPKEGEGNNSTMTENRNGGTGLKNNMGLSGSNNKANKDSVLFVAKLDNFFQDGKTPNPLYFVYDYYSKFDTATQTFEVDSLRPYNDLFSPDVAKVPLFFTKQDSTVLVNGMSTKNRKIVSAEIYNHNLSVSDYVAPSTSFFLQPISVPEENKDFYKSAYRTKMLVSDLNSAYFVYNATDDPFLQNFQKQRFEILRTADLYNDVPKDFLDYYTFMPAGAEYDSISNLAKQIVQKADARTVVDKTIAIKDYFLAKDEDNLPTFKYSDNPGVPGIPSANKLTFFLFENKKGYCAYYAGATLFLLRSLGIPSRIATGFLTVDRSNKNPGWYWFYEDQAHAWVQVYFPGYGWLDFDTTVPSQDQQDAPQPDQTPPLTSQKAYLVANGKTIDIDTLKKQVTMSVKEFLYWDKRYKLSSPEMMTMDISIARVYSDTGNIPLHLLKPNDEVVAVSYSEVFKNIVANPTDSGKSILKKFPSPAPIDELKVMPKDSLTKDKKEPVGKTKPTNWTNVFWTVTGLLLAALLFLLFLPRLIFAYYHYKATSKQLAAQGKWKELAFNRYIAINYYLNQMGYHRANTTALQFAQQKVDKQFGTNYALFLNTFLKSKYSEQPLNNWDEKQIEAVYPEVKDKIKAGIPTKKRFVSWMNIYRLIGFYTKPRLK